MFLNISSEIYKKIVLNEVMIHYNASSKHIIKTLGYYSAGSSFAVIQELAYFGNLKEFQKRYLTDTICKKHYKVSEDFLKYVAYSIVKSLEHLRNVDVLHQDIKLENILIDSDFNLKLSDFTVSVKLNKKISNFEFLGHGTNCYISPENIRKETVPLRDCFKNDYFGVGVLLYKLAFNKYPYNIDPNKIGKEEIKWKLTNEALSFPNNNSLSKEFLGLIENLLEKDYKKRYDMNNLLHSKWVNQGKQIIEAKNSYSDVSKYMNDLINENLVLTV